MEEKKFPMMMVFSDSFDPVGNEDEAVPYQILDYCRNEEQLNECARLFGIRDTHIENVMISIIEGNIDSELQLIHVFPDPLSIVPAHAALIERALIKDYMNG